MKRSLPRRKILILATLSVAYRFTPLIFQFFEEVNPKNKGSVCSTPPKTNNQLTIMTQAKPWQTQPGYIAPDSKESILSTELFQTIWDKPWTESQKESLSELLKNPVLHRFWCFLFDNSGEQWHQENYNFFHKLTNQPEINLDDYLPEETIKQLKGEDVPELLPNVKAEKSQVELLEKVFKALEFEGSVDERVTELKADPDFGLEKYGDWLVQFDNLFAVIHKPSKQAWSLPELTYDNPDRLAAWLTRVLLLLNNDQLKQLTSEFWYLQADKDEK